MKKTAGKRVLAALLCAFALFALAPRSARAAAFSDVPQGFWAGKEIAACVERGLFRGESETYFGAAHPMTRAAFAVVTSRFFGWEAGDTAYPIFSDVSAEAWYEPAVRACCEHDAIPREETAFRPNDPITRGEMAAILVRALGFGVIAQFSPQGELPFTDVATNRGYIAAAYELGIFKGVSATAFAPDRTSNRAQAAVVFARLYDKLHGAQGTTVTAWDHGDTPPNGAEIAVFPVLTMHGESPLFADRENAKGRLKTLHETGGKGLLQVYATGAILSADPAAVAATAASIAAADGYDGVFLNVSPASDYPKLAALAAAIRDAAGEKLLYAVVDVPSGGAIDLSALAKACDLLIVRVDAAESTASAIPVAAGEPLEAAYAALASVHRQTDKVALYVTAGHTAFRDGRRTALSDATFRTLWNAGKHYYSERYACAYLQNGVYTVWYLSERGLAARRQLAAFFDAGVFLSSATAPMRE